jgi:serine O-acetyltransferase
MISHTEPDWSREQKGWLEWDPSKSLLATIRKYQKYQLRGGVFWRLLAKWQVVLHRFWSVVTGADIPINCQIGGGLLLPHPNGIVVHPDVCIGPNCLLLQQVTLGMGTNGVPVLAGHVDVGAGAKVLGKIVLGEHSKVGANAVLLRDLPAHATAVGVPAKIINLEH